MDGSNEQNEFEKGWLRRCGVDHLRIDVHRKWSGAGCCPLVPGHIKYDDELYVLMQILSKFWKPQAALDAIVYLYRRMDRRPLVGAPFSVPHDDYTMWTYMQWITYFHKLHQSQIQEGYMPPIPLGQMDKMPRWICGSAWLHALCAEQQRWTVASHAVAVRAGVEHVHGVKLSSVTYDVQIAIIGCQRLRQTRERQVSARLRRYLNRRSGVVQCDSCRFLCALQRSIQWLEKWRWEFVCEKLRQDDGDDEDGLCALHTVLSPILTHDMIVIIAQYSL